MAILGIESVVYGVEDLGLCTRFWDEYGLVPVSRTERESVFEVASGSRVIVRRLDDPALPPGVFSRLRGSRDRVGSRLDGFPRGAGGSRPRRLRSSA